MAVVWVFCGWCEVGAEPPGLAYVFPAGGRRGERVEVRFGGYYLHGQAGFEVEGRGFSGGGALKPVATVFFDGPLILRPTSQQREDYPKDHAGVIEIASDAGVSAGLRAWTAQGVTASLRFVAGDFPEVVEEEREGVEAPVRVAAPVTVNGRMFPREDRDGWVFSAKKGTVMSCEVAARGLGYGWQPVLELKGPRGLAVAGAKWVQNRDGDPSVTFEVPEDGDYAVELRDAGYGGSQAHVYRMTVREGGAVTGIFPLGGAVGSPLKVQVERAVGGVEEVIQPVLAEGFQGLSGVRSLAGSWRLQGGSVREVTRWGDGRVEGLDDGLLPVPASVNGFIGAPGERHEWRVRMGAGETLRLRVRAGSLGSKMDPVVSVASEEGKELGKNDDAGDGTTDAALTYVAAKEGVYLVRVNERFPQRHGLSHAYRMEVVRGGAVSFGLRIAADFYHAVRSAPEGAPEPQGGKPPGKPPGLKVDLTESVGVAKEVVLEIEGLPEGVTYEPKVIPAKGKGVEVRFSVPSNLALQRVPIRVRGRVGEGDSAVVRDADVMGGVAGKAGTVLFAVVPRVPFRFIGEYMVVNDQPAGTTLKKTYRIDRGGYDGPLTVSLSDKQIRCLQRLQAKPVSVPRGAEFFDFEVLYPTEVQLGWTSRVQLMVTGEEAEPDGSRHLLTYTSSDTDDQMISIVTAGLLGVSGPRNSVLASPGVVEIPVRVRRHPSIEGRPVRVMLRYPAYVKGVKAIPLEIPAGEGDSVLRVEISQGAGPFLVPLEVFAETDGPHHASMAVDFVPKS
ncbi:MAG: hypothetical protein RIS92_2717 [Verrucomicrobiota bacterium]